MEATPIPAGTPGTHTDIETVRYADDSSATGPAPLPRWSPEQEDRAAIAGFVAGEGETAERWLVVHESYRSRYRRVARAALSAACR